MRIISDTGLGVATVWQECEGEPFEAKVAVAEVILRRAEQHYSSDGSIAGTVARRYQFSAWNDDKQNNARLILSLKLDDSHPVVAECVRAWNRAFSGPETVPGAVLFYNPAAVSKPPAWATPDKFVKKVGSHLFYRG